MKELSIEERAQRYDEAIKRARALNNGETVDAEVGTTVCEYIFPELKESEDERIRKELIEKVKETPACIGFNDKNAVLAWLEKQGEQKPYGQKAECLDCQFNYAGECKGSCSIKRNEQKPRYSIGDVLCYKSGTTLNKVEIIDIRNGMYICDNGSFPISQQDDYELVAKKIGQKPADKVEPKYQNGQWIVWQNKFYKVNYNGCGYELIDQNGLRTSLEYATVDKSASIFTIQDAKDGDVLVSELSDSIILFKCIEDNNIQFYCDYDFSEIDVPGDRFAVNDSGQHYGSVEDSKDIYPATKEQRDVLMKAMANAGWTFDFEKKELKKIHIIDEGKAEMDYCFTKMMNGEKVNSAWSEEDERMFISLKTLLNYASNYLCTEGVDKIRSWLKSLRPQNWTKEDKERYISCLKRLGTGNPEQPETSNSKWFKEHVYPQRQWKPSEEQITWLYRAADDASKDSRMKQILNELLSDLKKLIE